MDEIDQTQATAERIMEAALAHHRATQPKGESATHCADCEDPIPEARRQAAPGCTRCIHCQQQHELLAHWRQP